MASTASKIAVIGDVNGQFAQLFDKISSLQTKHNFAFVLIVGNLFADPLVATAEDEANVKALLDGQIHVPTTTYFAVGSHALPPSVVSKVESPAQEVCENLLFLGRGILKTSEGIRIVVLGGQLDPNITAGVSKDRFLPYYTIMDAKALKGAHEADILITTQWPTGIRTGSAIEFQKEEPLSQQCVADLCLALKPRYHFATSPGVYYEREPFFHEKNEDDEFRITRFISLAEFGNTSKQKWIFAFSLDPRAPHPKTLPPVATASPLFSSEKKRPAPDDGSLELVYEDSGRRGRHHKRRRGEQKPMSATDCFFCLSNENIATHLITSIGDFSYMTVAKGPLSTQTTYPKLDFPGHHLIIPLAHQPTLAGMEEQERKDTFSEMLKYRSCLNKLLKKAAGEEYGSVTWEVSKSSLMHTHWQYMPVPTSVIRNRSVEAAFTALAKNLHYPTFVEEDVGDGIQETSDFFRVLIWDPKQEEGKYQSLVLRFDEKVKFHLQFGREVIGKLLRLDARIDWRACGQTQQQEEADVAKFKEAFKEFDFTE